MKIFEKLFSKEEPQGETPESDAQRAARKEIENLAGQGITGEPAIYKGGERERSAADNVDLVEEEEN